MIIPDECLLLTLPAAVAVLGCLGALCVGHYPWPPTCP